MNVNLRNFMLDSDEDLDATGTFQRMPKKQRFDDDSRGRVAKKKQSHRPRNAERHEVEAA